MTTYISTRGAAGQRSFEDVLLAGLAEDGGLFVPYEWPALPEGLAGLDYAETTARVIEPFVGDCFTGDELQEMCRQAYAGFRHPATAPIRQLAPNQWLLELFHGPTLAFKDFALQLLALMFEHVLQRAGREIIIVGATSGDTGSAAIHACAGKANIRIAILHPKGRVSEVQRRQMTTVAADNVVNIAVEGDFDDCQALVKAMFNDLAYREEMHLAAINSINWARVMAQAAYYVYAAKRLANPAIFCVPTGNFGDVYAGYVAHRMGLPVAGLVVATNENDILARFLKTGRYEASGVTSTISPSMDIQVASNFERLLFDLEHRDGEHLREMMDQFAQTKRLEVAGDRLDQARDLFTGLAVSEAETKAMIATLWRETGELIDPHTAVGVAAAAQITATSDTPIVTLATAHPAKFPAAVKDACGIEAALPPHLSDIFEREERYDVQPNDLETLKRKLRGKFSPRP